MNYKRINEHEIEIIPGETPIHKVLETMAKVSYESAKPPGSEFLELLGSNSEEVDFSKFVHLNGHEVLDMGYVNERPCKTKVRKTDEGKFVFDAWLYETNRGPSEPFLAKVKSALQEDTEDSGVSTRSGKYKSARRRPPGRWRWLELLLELLSPF
jgi:hypothetical protein